MKFKIVTQTFDLMIFIDLKRYEPNPYREVDCGELRLPNSHEGRDVAQQIIEFFQEFLNAEWENLDEA